MSRVFVLLTSMFPRKSFFTASTSKLPGWQHQPQSGNLLLTVRAERNVSGLLHTQGVLQHVVLPLQARCLCT
jgi:hypothetical protein